jgi:hypothetical protein
MTSVLISFWRLGHGICNIFQIEYNILPHVWVTIDGDGLVIGFIEHLQIVTTSNYSAVANSHTPQFTTACTKSSQSALYSPVVAWWRIQELSSASALTFLPAGDCPTTNSQADSHLTQIAYISDWPNSLQSQSHSQSYFTTGGLSQISLSCRQALRGSRPEFFFFWQLNSCGHSPITSSLTRGGVCLIWIRFASPLSSLRIAHIACYWKYFLCTIYKPSVSPGFAKQIMSSLLILCYNGSLVTWTVVSLTTAKFKPLIFSVWFRLVLYCEYVHSQDFIWLLLVAYTILLHDRTHMEGWKPCANRGPVCTLENFQWCGEPCFAGAAILTHCCRATWIIVGLPPCIKVGLRKVTFFAAL